MICVHRKHQPTEIEVKHVVIAGNAHMYTVAYTAGTRTPFLITGTRILPSTK